MTPRYRVTLTLQERDHLTALTKDANTRARRFRYARVLLLCDQGPHGPGWTVARVAQALGIATRTIERLKQRFVEEGLEAALQRKQPQGLPSRLKFDGAFEARLIALACSQAPLGRCRWTVRLLADKVVELGYTDKVSHMTVQRILKKTACAPT